MTPAATSAEFVEPEDGGLMMAMLDALESPTCAVDSQGVIIAVNAAWLRFGIENGARGAAIGSDYLAACDGATGAWSEHAGEVGKGLRAVLGGRSPRFEVDYPCHSPGVQRWFSLRLSPLPGFGALVSHHDVTAMHLEQRALRARVLLRDPVAGSASDGTQSAAEAASSRARLRGPGQPGVAGPAVRTPGARVVTPADLRAAMHRDELVLHYQPVVDLVSGKVTAVEALVRWQHRVDGLIGPDSFIPVAERHGLIVGLGERVLERACAQAVLWRSQGLDLEMAVNLSTVQVTHPGLLQTLQAVLLHTGMDPSRLILELTESAVMEDAEAAARVLTAVADLGVSLAIDDFGTGYSSLVYLKRYPIRALKIDRSFVAGMGISDEDDAIVASVVGLARAVGGSCIAEGIETEAQYVALRALGGNLGQGWLYGQGWHFGRAVPADELPELVAGCEARLANGHDAPPTPAEERDDVGAERDRAADTRDLCGDERDLAAQHRDEVGDRRDRAAQHRDRAGDDRDQLADERDLVADQRDEAADDRDLAGQRRDRIGRQRDWAAAERDKAADRRDAAAERVETARMPGTLTNTDAAAVQARLAAASDRLRAALDRGAGTDERTLAEADRGTASENRGAGADERALAESERGSAFADRLACAGERGQAQVDRSLALADRGAGAGARWRAEQDRTVALADRFAAAGERREATVDGLTGVLRRDVGFVELEREIARAGRTHQPLVIAFVDVDHLKSINDTFGHPAGDRLLAQVARGLVAALRPYDLVLRYGGDEFVCALSGADLASATTRLGLLNPALSATLEHGSVSMGLAQLRPDETLEALVARADEALYVQRRLVRGQASTARGSSDVPDEPLAG